MPVGIPRPLSSTVTDPSAPSWDLEARLRAAAGPAGGAAVDVSAQRVALRLEGLDSRWRATAIHVL